MTNDYFNVQAYYKLLLTFRKNKYKLIPFNNYIENNKDKYGILRHDVDFYLPYALEIAKIEQKLGINSTYFILTNGDFYDPFTAENILIIKEIFSMGHEIGIHWSSNKYGENVVEGFLKDKKQLEKIVGKKVFSASQHDPTATQTFDISPYIKNNAYSKRFINNQLIYLSDSTMRWRKYTPLDLVALQKSFHFLSHPIWWVAEGDDFSGKVLSLSSKANMSLKVIKDYLSHAKKVLSERSKRDQIFSDTIR